MSQSNLVRRAQKFCELSKYRYTEPRARVLSLLANCHEPMGAYKIIEALSSRTEKINPPTVYRAIEFWQQHGFVHRIESMNAYIACCEHNPHENFCIFICTECHSVIELNLKGLPASLTSGLEKKNLTIESSMTEVRGKCSQCN